MNRELTTAAKIVCVLSAILLILAIPDWQYGYYEILRWFVTLSSILALYWYYTAESGSKVAWILLLSITAVVFNPVAPVALDKATWVVLDMATAFLFIAASMSIWRRSSLGSKSRSAEIDIFLSDDGQSIKILNNSMYPLHTKEAILNGSFRISSFILGSQDERILKLNSFLDDSGKRFDTSRFGIKRLRLTGSLRKKPVEIVFGERSL